MVAKEFEVGDLVWAKMKSYPEWPAEITHPPASAKPRKAQHYVFFFGTQNYSWIPDDKITHHSDEMLKKELKKKYFKFEEAVEEIKNKAQDSSRKPKSPSKEVEVEKEISPKQIKKVKKIKLEKANSNDNSVNKQYKFPVKKDVVTGEKKFLKTTKKRLSEEHSPKPSKKRPTEEKEEDSVFKTPKKAEYSMLLDSVIPSIGQSVSDHHTIVDPEVVQKENSDISEQADFVDEGQKEVKKKIKKVGFLGLGLMGRGMVKNLIKFEHSLVIWNRTAEKCDEFKDEPKVRKAACPADVVKECDITFCCVSDPHAVRTIMFAENGVLAGLKTCTVPGKKGYVEMSSIDSNTSNELAEAVTNAGMKYLEAPIIGSRKSADEGTILILGAGDRELFNSCENCFHAMSKHAYYISCDVGRSAYINIITSTFLGNCIAALAEALSLTDRIKLERNDLLEILELRGIITPMLMAKGKAMIEKVSQPDTFLKNQEKDISLCLRLSESNNHPTPISASAHAMYVRSKGMGYSDSDSSSVYSGYKA